MAWIIGAGLAVLVALFARVTSFDRDRAFYPTVLIVVGGLYILFASMAGGQGVPLEILFSLVFTALAVIGYRTSLWIVAAGLALHGLFDFARAAFLPGSGVPSFWPAFCASYDVVAAAGLAILLMVDARRVTPRMR